MAAPTHLDLFSGIGGFALSAKWAGFRTVAFVEIDPYCQKVLAKNFGAISSDSDSDGCGDSLERQNQVRQFGCGDTPTARCYSNIFDLNGRDFAGVSLITGGFPCQPFSVAGKRGGAADDRAIWPQMFRVISEARPAWVLGENVPGIIPMELDNVLSDLEGIGYATRSFVIPACAVDARHRRDRVWIVGRLVGQPSSNGFSQNQTLGVNSTHSEQPAQHDAYRFGSSNANANQQGLEGQREISGGTGTQLYDTGDHCRWEPQSRLGGMVDELSDWLDGPYCTFPPEPNIPRVSKGVKNRVDRLKGLGNSILPRVAYEILREIRKLI